MGKLTEREYLIRVDRHLDLGEGSIRLTDALICATIIENLLFHAGAKYDLLAWVVMINHVHLLLRPINGNSLESIVHSLKSYTANKSNKLLGRSGPFWSIEYFDRYIRDGEHFTRTKRYIEMNPVKAGLCSEPEEWKFGSAYYDLLNSNRS
ncbi:MAG: transposase [Blastocatellia bacterium]|nr:transposase [Blastocatellia bacterium]